MLFLNFNVKENSVGGNTGCNDLGGKIVVTSDKIAFSDMWMTKMFCIEAKYEITFVDYLFHSEPLKFKIENNVLTFSEDGKVIMTFERTK
jgi:heat shock protein HslJ